MSAAGQPPKPRTAKKGQTSFWERIRSDKDVLGASRFLKKMLIGVVTMTAAVSLAGAGAFVVARVIHLIYTALEAQKIGLPEWAHQAEVQGTGLVIVILVLLAVVITVKDAWHVGTQTETAEEPEEENTP